MKVAIVGSRSFDNMKLLQEKVYELTKGAVIEEIISGGAHGADNLARIYAVTHNLPLIEFIPKWQEHGKAAGPIRNKYIVDRADIIIAFWDGISKGTKSSIDLAKKHNKELYVIEY